ncbi:hypothetical protein [Williamsia soli]|uniref:hypothetical protein n=1 Tax=Williamsia soli TaxID=364929 RepID=UPI001A9E7E6F|nr:hypothetical protein [Williamsia soli]
MIEEVFGALEQCCHLMVEGIEDVVEVLQVAGGAAPRSDAVVVGVVQGRRDNGAGTFSVGRARRLSTPVVQSVRAVIGRPGARRWVCRTASMARGFMPVVVSPIGAVGLPHRSKVGSNAASGL